MVESVIDTRSRHDETREALYDPRYMPRDLRDAHNHLDRTVDKLFAPRRKLTTEAERLALLLERYQDIETAGTLSGPVRRTRKRAAT